MFSAPPCDQHKRRRHVGVTLQDRPDRRHREPWIDMARAQEDQSDERFVLKDGQCPKVGIVVLDSGLGGLTVVRALRTVLPAEDIVYFGDTARLPYGNKSPATVTHFVTQIIQYLRPYKPKHVVIACNTATALALPAVRRVFPELAISGVVEPGARAAVEAVGSRRLATIGLIATEATVRSGAYEQAIAARRQHVRVHPRPAPLLVPIIEEGRSRNDPLVELAVRQYIEPLLNLRIDVLVLGCTHYPLLKDVIARIAGSGVAVIDSSEQCADDVARRLRRAGLCRANTATGVAGRYGQLTCYVTDDTPRFGTLASRFLGTEIAPPRWVSPDELYGIRPVTQVRMAG